MATMSRSRWSQLIKSLHFPLLWLIVLSLMVNWGTGYRALLYLNFFALLAYCLIHARQLMVTMSPMSWAMLAVPVTFTLLHWVAVGQFEIIKEIRQMWLAVFLAISVWAFDRHRIGSHKPLLERSLVILLVVYALAQVIAIAVFSRPYGTNKNPHYLAFYCSMGLMLGMYLFYRTTGWWRASLVLMSPVLSYLLLTTSSRPAWIALIFAALVVLMLAKVRSKRLMLAVLITLPTALFISNVGDFGSRLTELIQNIDHEERVVIWQNAWAMQKASLPNQWIWGHGLDSFQEAFKSYSSYHGILDFNSPHNSVVELLYTSGVIGLGCFILFYLMLYYQLLRLSRMSSIPTAAGLMIAALTFNLLFISITIPTFSSYNLYLLGLVIGGTLWLKRFPRGGHP
jgi:O-antigen ligase